MLDEIAAIDERLNTVSEQYDGARLRLTALRHDLKSERASLAVAKAPLRAGASSARRGSSSGSTRRTTPRRST